MKSRTSLILAALLAAIAVPAWADRAAQLEELYEQFFEASLERNPVRATYIGDHRWSDRWPNTLSEEYREAEEAFQREWLKRLRAVGSDGLDGQDLISYRIFESQRERALEGMKFPSHLVPIQQFYNPANRLLMLGSGTGAQRFETVEDYDRFIRRATEFVGWLDQAMVNMREGMEKGVVQPKVLMERVLPQLQAHIVDDPADSLLFKPLESFPEDAAEGERERVENAYRTLIADTLVPAFQRLHDFIEDEYIPAARDSHGMAALPGGAEWYAWLVSRTTTTDLSPAEIHQIGLREVERIHSEIEQIMEEVEFEGDLQAFFAFTRDDPQFVFDSRADLLQAYEDLRENVETAANEIFELAPQAGYEIRAVEPFRERSASSASYQRPAADGSRPGIFYVNAYDLSARPTWTVESLFLHEAVPGHHFQLALQQETEDLPRFRRFGGFTAYTEGWGLYSEHLGYEMGIYDDPWPRFGALSAELWRAIRLVVDTGLHYHGWSREQVLEYMYANSAAAEARAVSEAERFMAIPSQALAYKIGELKLRELRAEAKAALGDDFDVSAFHARVLETGAVPLDVLEMHMHDWVEADQSS